VYINKEKGLRAICHSLFRSLFWQFFNHFQRHIKFYVRIWTNQTIQRNG